MKKYKQLIKTAIWSPICLYGAIFVYYFVISLGDPFLAFWGNNPFSYAYHNTNDLIQSPYKKMKRSINKKNAKKDFFEKITQKDPDTIRSSTNNILRSYLSYAEDFTEEQLLELIKTAENNNDITPLYYYLLYTTPNLYSQSDTTSPVKNPFYQVDKAWGALEQAAFKGSQNAQILLSHYYEYGVLFSYKTSPDPIEALAWKTNAKFQNNESIIFNLQPLNKNTFIYEEISRLNILDIEKANARINDVIAKYPIKYFLEDRSDRLSEKVINHQKGLIEKSNNGNHSAIEVYAEELYTGGLGINDYESSHQWYQKIFDVNDSNSLLNLSLFYSTEGSEKNGLNPYYNQEKSLDYLVTSGMLGNSTASSFLYSLYDRGYSVTGLKTPIDKPIATAWFVIQRIDKNGIIKLLRNDEISITQLLGEYSEEDKTRALKLIDEYRDLHNIPKL